MSTPPLSQNKSPGKYSPAPAPHRANNRPAQLRILVSKRQGQLLTSAATRVTYPSSGEFGSDDALQGRESSWYVRAERLAMIELRFFRSNLLIHLLLYGLLSLRPFDYRNINPLISDNSGQQGPIRPNRKSLCGSAAQGKISPHQTQTP
jgi:hypothetical protein